jgi:hypothetical protein
VPRAIPFSSLEERVKWLLAHSSFLEEPFDKKKTVSAMQRDGLFSKRTYWFDVNLDDAVKQAKLRRKTND